TRGEAAARAHEDRCQDPSLGKGAETQKSKFAKRTWNVPLNQLDRKMELRSEAVKPEFRSSMPGSVWKCSRLRLPVSVSSSRPLAEEPAAQRNVPWLPLHEETAGGRLGPVAREGSTICSRMNFRG